jgi:CNT family concentrative nucleoside transporter
MTAILQSGLGLFALIGIAFAFSEKRSEIPWKTVCIAVFVQFVVALILIKIPFTRQVFVVLNTLVYMLEKATQAGTSFVFGYLGGASPPFADAVNGGSDYILAFRSISLPCWWF